jgi:hypothetical protein
MSPYIVYLSLKQYLSSHSLPRPPRSVTTNFYAVLPVNPERFTRIIPDHSWSLSLVTATVKAVRAVRAHIPIPSICGPAELERLTAMRAVSQVNVEPSAPASTTSHAAR